MKLVVALHHHFRKASDGTVYPYHVFNYSFWEPYLEVFDEVYVFARMGEVNADDSNELPAPASGPGVNFIELPDFQGFKGMMKASRDISRIAKQALEDSYAYILRPPSFICDILWRQLSARHYPYAVEVVGDPWDAYSPGSVKTPLRPIIRRVATQRLKKQCKEASLASYVTEFGLQSRYPAGNWSTHFSDIILNGVDIVDSTQLFKRHESYKDAKKTIRLCTVGSLWHLAKAQDVLISAVAQCIGNGINLELVIVGDGSFKKQLQKQAEDLGIGSKVLFTGHLSPGKDVFNELDNSDIYVLPSRQEGLPRSVIEAMARGLPCITSDVSGLPELVEEKYLVKPDDVEQLADKISLLANNSNELSLLANNSNELIRLSNVNVAIAHKYEFNVLKKRRVEMYTRLKELTLKYVDRK